VNCQKCGKETENEHAFFCDSCAKKWYKFVNKSKKAFLKKHTLKVDRKIIGLNIEGLKADLEKLWNEFLKSE
jgi:hypothetical protein